MGGRWCNFIAMSFVPGDKVCWWGRRDSILLYLVIDRGGERGEFCSIFEGLTLCLSAVCLRVRPGVLHDCIVSVEERGRVLLHVVSIGGNRYG